MTRPPLKWAGGKRQILDAIKSRFPPESDINAYHEPFFGGGAVFFKTGPHAPGSTINDINTRLMNFYRQVRDNPHEVIEHLRSFDRPTADPDPSRDFHDENRKGKEITQYYYQQRELFNRRPNGEAFDPVEEAALLMYLNRTCYNGLYRENNSGEFNVPIGRQSSADWVQASRIREASKALQDVKMFDGDFSYVREHVEEDDLVYFDPPYEPVSATSSFVEYSMEEFDTEEQERLRDLAVELHEAGAHVVLSNSPPVRELYVGLEEFDVYSVGAKRQINSVGDDRGEVEEIIITTVDRENLRERTPTLMGFSNTDSDSNSDSGSENEGEANGQ